MNDEVSSHEEVPSGERGRPSVPQGSPRAPPYKFLDYFEEVDQASFAGRDDEVQEALSGLTRGRTFVLYSRSGLGKTSLLLAGVFPRLRQRGFRPLRVRLLESPVEDFCGALAVEFQLPELARKMESAERQELVPRVLGELSAHEPLVIVLDQFEEFFVRFRERPAERAELVALLGRLYREQAANIRLVFCLREDYYAELEDLRAELPELTQYGLRLLPFTAYGARQAIVRPLQHARAAYEEGFVNRLVDLLADWNFEPPVLQIVCTELYRDVLARRSGPVELRREDLERLGGVDGLFRAYVNRVTSGLAAERLLLVRVVMDALISSERTRYALRAEDLLAGPVRAGYEEIRAVLDHLTDQGLLRVERRKGERWFELLHERLMSICNDWLAMDVDYARFRTAHELVVTLSADPQWRTHPDWLLTAPQLHERVDPWKEQLRLDEQQAEFLLRSSIHGQADSVAGWAARFDEFGEGRSVKLVLSLLEHPALVVRRNAATSCGKMRDGTGQLATRCLALAVSDLDEQVRGAARTSFVRLARPEEFAMLQRALEAPEQREFALELLADLLEAGRSLAGIPKPWQHRAEAIVRARWLKREQLTIRSRTITGAEVGGVTALLWSFSFGLVAAAYWVCTLFPERITVHWPNIFLGDLRWLIIDNIPFVFVPWGLLLGGYMARQVANTAATKRREDWNATVLRSGGLMISCVVLHLSVLITTEASSMMSEETELARQLNLPFWAVFVPVLLVASVMEWLQTVGFVWLGSRCITSGMRSSRAYLYAALSSAAYPMAFHSMLNMVAWWGGLRFGAFRLVLLGLAASSTFVTSFQTVVLVSVLATERLRLAPVPLRRILWARAVVLLSVPVVALVFLEIHGLRTFPFMGRQYPLVTEVAIEGRTWQHERDVEYFFLTAPPGGPFAFSVHDRSEARTRLFMGGQEFSTGMLLVSGWSRVMGAVGSIPSLEVPGQSLRSLPLRADYHYLLRREPIQEGEVGELQPGRWALARLPLVQVNGGPGEPRLWQVSLKGQVSPLHLQEGRGSHMLVLPLLVNVAELEPGACMGISSSTHVQSETADTFVLTNQAGIASVPPLKPQEELFAEGLRLSPGEDGAWSLTLTITRLMNWHPRKCEAPPTDNPLPAGAWTRKAPDLYGAQPSLFVAVMLY